MTTNVIPMLVIPDVRRELADPADRGSWVPVEPLQVLTRREIKQHGLRVACERLGLPAQVLAKIAAGAAVRWASIELLHIRFQQLHGRDCLRDAANGDE